MGLLAVIGPSKKENRCSAFAFLLKYCLRMLFFRQNSMISSSSLGKFGLDGNWFILIKVYGLGLVGLEAGMVSGYGFGRKNHPPLTILASTPINHQLCPVPDSPIDPLFYFAIAEQH